MLDVQRIKIIKAEYFNTSTKGVLVKGSSEKKSQQDIFTHGNRMKESERDLLEGNGSSDYGGGEVQMQRSEQYSFSLNPKTR